MKPTIPILHMPTTKLARVTWPLRLAFAGICLLASASAAALWARSHFQADLVRARALANIELVSVKGQFKLTLLPDPVMPKSPRVTINSFSVDQREAHVMESHVRHYSNPRGFGAVGRRAILLPYWFPVTLFGLVAMAFGIRWPQRYSLRAFLFAASVVSIIAGLLAVAMR